MISADLMKQESIYCETHFRSSLDKIRYLRYDKKYTQEECSEITSLSLRQVQRLDKRIKDSNIIPVCRKNVVFIFS